MPTGARQPGAAALRKGRRSLPGQIYLVTTITHLRQPLFADLHAGRQVVAALRREPRAETLAYVVMPDHLHWLLALKGDSALGMVVQAVKSISARGVNRSLHRSGPVWQPGFHDHALRREEDLQGVARYIVANPLRAGLVRSVREYPLWDACWL
jgi:REP element-mobilizing transposase RayT